ncbi:MAG: spore cortex biosynthesis protein YabQ [Clostridia bacterium]|nr:spore cortex biosynthesis protein YabQ [Clostridia bacterium]
MREINFIGQITTFGYSLLLGALFCLPYDLMRTIELRFIKSRVAVFLLDISFFFLAGLFTFLFLQVTCSGEVRGFVFAGELLGFFLTKRLISSPIRWFLSFIFDGVGRLFSNLKRVFHINE